MSTTEPLEADLLLPPHSIVLLMNWQRWTKRGVGTILAAVAILLTAFPLPTLPLRWLPAGAAVVLAIMLFWEQRPVPDIPTAHADELRKLGLSIQDDFKHKSQIQFGRNKLQAQHLRTSFRSHFRRYARKLDDWDKLVEQYQAAEDALWKKAQEVAGAENLSPVIDAAAVLDSTALFYTRDEVPPDVAFNETAHPDKTTTISYGLRPIANLSNPAAQQVTDKISQIQNLLASVGAWPEVSQVRSERLKLEALAESLGPEAARISMSHNLSVVAKCPICPS